MKLKNYHQKFIDELLHKEVADFDVGGFTVSVYVLENGHALHLKTSVYNGHNYIPPSVREGLNSQPPFSYGALSAKLTLSEESFQIHLNYRTELSSFESHKFFNLLDEYSWLAHQWRDFFDDQDRKDLIYVK